jgi:hypothetical protein
MSAQKHWCLPHVTRSLARYVNVDEGWLQGRYPANNTIYEDLTKFPSGMKALGVSSATTGIGPTARLPSARQQ